MKAPSLGFAPISGDFTPENSGGSATPPTKKFAEHVASSTQPPSIPVSENPLKRPDAANEPEDVRSYVKLGTSGVKQVMNFEIKVVSADDDYNSKKAMELAQQLSIFCTNSNGGMA